MPHRTPSLTVPQLVEIATTAGETVRSLSLGTGTATHAILSRQPVGRHVHADLCLSVHLATPDRVEADAGEGRTADVATRAEDTFVWRAGASRHMDWLGRLEFVAVHLPGDYLRDVAFESTGGRLPEIAGQVAIQDPFITSVALAFREEMSQVGRGTLFRDSMLTALAAHLLTRYATPWIPDRSPKGGLTPSALARVVAHIRDHLAEDIGLADLARAARMSRFHFARAFRASTGRPPHQYVVARRVEYAQHLLLRRPALSVAQVAAACGFADSSHLARHFRRVVGVTPNAFRGQNPK